MVFQLLSIDQFTKDDISNIFACSQDMKKMVLENGTSQELANKILANVFYEPSTRTSCSFQAAMLRLGGKVFCVNESSSSVKKGESLADTMRCMESYADVIVLRHPTVGSAKEAASAVNCPLINAGDGIGEHPTQALLDAFTIFDELGELDGKTITMVGDLKHGRTVHSLAKLLSQYNVKFIYVSCDELAMPAYIKDGIAVEQTETNDLNSVIADSDVIYVTRIQKERFANEIDYEAVKNHFKITKATLEKAKEKMIIMHPLPRVDEISTEVDADPRAAYFRQMKNGMYVRMALLKMAFND